MTRREKLRMIAVGAFLVATVWVMFTQHPGRTYYPGREATVTGTGR